MAVKKKTTTKKQKREVIELVTPMGRVSFPSILTPDEKGQFPTHKFKLDLMFPKAPWTEGGSVDKGFKSCPGGAPWKGWKAEAVDMKQAVLTIARKHFKDPNLTLSDFQHPFKDGDTKNTDSFKGNIIITPKSGYKPEVLNAQKEPMSDEEIAKIRGGDYARLVVRVYGYDGTNAGVTFGLQVVQFIKKGESLGGGREVSVKMLDEVEVEMPDDEEEAEDSGDDDEEMDQGLTDDEEDEEEEVAAPPKKNGKAAAPKKKKARKESDTPDDDDEYADVDSKTDIGDFDI